MSTVNVKTTITAEFSPFSVPRYVQQVNQDGSSISRAIENVERNVVDALVERWLDNVYANLKTSNPWKRVSIR